jgi:hypothetical protein
VAFVPIAEALLWKLARWAWRWRGSHIALLLLLLLCLAPDNTKMSDLVLNYQIDREMQRHFMEDVIQPQYVPLEGKWYPAEGEV